MPFRTSVVLAAAFWTAIGPVSGAEPVKKTAWQGAMHIGDNPEKHPKVASAGMGFQVPVRLAAGKLTKLTVTAEGVETQAGNGHYAEVVAHFEKQPAKAPAKEVVVGTFRLKDDSGREKGFEFEFDSGKHLGGTTPDYYSVRVRVDTHIALGLWDDFLVKRIDVEQTD
jgi:hypothetical protein